MNNFIPLLSVIFLCFCSLHAADVSILDKSTYYKKAETQYSVPKLDIVKVSLDLLMKSPAIRTQLMDLLHAEAETDPDVQERLYMLLTKSFGADNLIDSHKAGILLDKALEQRQVWAYLEKAKIAGAKNPVTRWHYLAANQSNAKALDAIKPHLPKNLAHDIAAIVQLKNQKKLVEEVEKFITSWNERGYAQPLYELARSFSSTLKDNKKLADKTYAYALRTAADLGHLKAQQDYTALLASFDVNHKDILKYKLMAAQQGDKNAIFDVGFMIEHGVNGQTTDEARAFKYYLLAAEKGHVKAILQAGFLLHKGFSGQERDRMRALQFWLDIKDRDIDALRNAALYYEAGFDGQKADPDRAFALFMQAAQQGDN